MSTAQDRAVRAIDIAISLVEREELRLRAVIESDKASADERFRALQDLAYLSEIVVRELADIHVGASAEGSSAQSPETRHRSGTLIGAVEVFSSLAAARALA